MSVAPGAPADRAGIRPGDLLVAAGDRLLTSVDDLHRLLSLKFSNRQFLLTVVRDSRKFEVLVEPALDG